jgi:hypothetical protein
MGHTLKNWYKWDSLESFNVWHNQIKEQLDLPKMSVDITGQIVPDAVINSAYTEVHHIAENDYRAFLADEYADGLELSDNPFPSNYQEQLS